MNSGTPRYPTPIHPAGVESTAEIDEQAFFTTTDGYPTVVTGGDLARTLAEAGEKLIEVDRYWTVYPYSFISVCRSEAHNEYRYYVVEPTLSDDEQDLISLLTDQLRGSFRHMDESVLTADDRKRRQLIRQKALELLARYNLYRGSAVTEAHEKQFPDDSLDVDEEDTSIVDQLGESVRSLFSDDEPAEQTVTYSGPTAQAYGASMSSEYLPITGAIAGHPGYTDSLAVPADAVDETGFALSDVVRAPADAVIPSDVRVRPDGVYRFGQSGTNTDADANGESATDGDSPIVLPETVSGEGLISGDDAEVTHYRVEPEPLYESLMSGTQGATATDGGAVGQSPAELSADVPEADSVEDALGLGRDGVIAAAFVDDDDTTTLTEYQVYKLLYYLERNFVGYKKIDAMKNDQQVEDITCNGYNRPVFVYHGDYEQILTNVNHGRGELDSFVTTLSQFANEEVSRRSPQADATLPDGSRAQLTLGTEVSDKGTNYTIRQFKDVPFTPIDLINWNTYSLDQMAQLWLAAETGSSILVAGGTASGKTTTLNALSLFIPPTDKVVSIEDTQELNLPQKNWTAQVTREGSSTEGKKNTIDEFDLLESSLRQRPDYILMGEVRGEEGRTLFQIVSTGHTSFTTFHADSVEEVIKRFTTDPINVSRTLMEALDFVAVQQQTVVDGEKVRRATSLTEVSDYDPRRDELTVTDVYEWDASTDTHKQTARSNVLDKLATQMGWDTETLARNVRERKAVLAYLLANDIKAYEDVAAVIQGYMTDSEIVLSLIENGALEDHIESLKSIGNVSIDTEMATEELVTRPSAPAELVGEAKSFLQSQPVKAMYEAVEADTDNLQQAADPADGAASGQSEPAAAAAEQDTPGGEEPQKNQSEADTTNEGREKGASAAGGSTTDRDTE